jgi:hypothetical protein
MCPSISPHERVAIANPGLAASDARRVRQVLILIAAELVPALTILHHQMTVRGEQWRADHDGDHSVVRHAHGVGNRRWPGQLLGPQSARIGRGRASLWSDVVVSLAANRLGRDRLLMKTQPA